MGYFTKHTHQPSPEEIRLALGSLYPLWERLTQFINTKDQITREWSTWGPANHGWGLRFRRKGKALGTQDAIDKATHWALGLPDSFLITAGDMQLLPKMLDAANRFEARPSDAEMATDIEELDIQPIFS